MKKSFLSLQAALLMLVMLAPLSSLAATFITDVKVIGGSKSTTNTLKSEMKAQGWVLVDYDLNKGCGGSSDYIYLLYKTGSETDNPITGIYISDYSKTAEEVINHNGKAYHLVPFDGDSHFCKQQGDLNSNARGATIRLYYTKGQSADRNALTNIVFNETQLGATGVNGGSEGYDLNEGTSGPKIYMHLSFSKIPQGNELIWEPFDEYTPGNKLATSAIAQKKTYWTTWSKAPGTSEDATVEDFGGSYCAHIVNPNDQVLLLGDKATGTYDIEFDVLAPYEKTGYFNILHAIDGGDTTWGLAIDLGVAEDEHGVRVASGHATIHAAGNTYDIRCAVDQWMHFHIRIYADNDQAELYITLPNKEENLVLSWQWSLDAYRGTEAGNNIAAIDFYSGEDPLTSFYVDNISFKGAAESPSPNPPVYGDVNSDQAVDVADIAAIIDVMAQSIQEGELFKAADVNGDGAVDVADIATVIDVMASYTN